MAARRTDWTPIVNAARDVVLGSTLPITLRGVHYRLVAQQTPGYANDHYSYKRLSALTAAGRRDGTFPDLADFTRSIERPQSWTDAQAALRALADQYRDDRTDGQPVSLYVGVEKRTLVPLLTEALDGRGIPLLPLGGYGSQTFVDRIAADVVYRARPAVLLYLGDFDPSGEDIQRDLLDRAGVFTDVERVALTSEQVDAYNLPVAIGKAGDARSAAFEHRHGRLVQVELEALPPDELARLVEAAIAPRWDTTQFEAVLDRERIERAYLDDLASA